MTDRKNNDGGFLSLIAVFLALCRFLHFNSNRGRGLMTGNECSIVYSFEGTLLLDCALKGNYQNKKGSTFLVLSYVSVLNLTLLHFDIT